MTTGRRSEVLRVLREASGPLGIAAVAAELGVHPNTVRFHLDVLLRNGQVEQVEQVDARRGSPGRPASLFQAVRRMDSAGARRYRLLAEILSATVAADPDPRSRASEAGRAWGRQLVPPSAGDTVEQLVDLLAELDFAPEVQEAEPHDRIALRHCPFLELAETQGQVICPIHEGLMQGALEAWGSHVTVSRLEAFAESDLCLAHLSPAMVG